MSGDHQDGDLSFTELFSSLDVDDNLDTASDRLSTAEPDSYGNIDDYTRTFLQEWEIPAESSAEPDRRVQPGTFLASAVQRVTGNRGDNRRLSDKLRGRDAEFARFCTSRAIAILQSSGVANAEQYVDPVNLPRFVLVLTGPLANLSIRKALWLATLVLYRSSSGGGIPTELIAEVLGYIGKVVDGKTVPYTEAELQEIMFLSGFTDIHNRSPHVDINLGDLPGDGYDIPDVNAGFSFDYIRTEVAAKAIRICENVCKDILANNPPGIQELNIPLIKGASGCGKTRLGREIAVNIIAKAREKNNNHKAVHILRRMDLFPALHSQSFINRRTGRVDGEAMLLANLVCLSDAVPNALRYPRRPVINFDLDTFLEHAKTRWGIDLILFQIDEYRRDLDGATAMLDTCAKRIIANPRGAKVYPIITGMTSYVEVYDDAIGRSSAISEYPGIFTHHLGTIQGPYRTAMELTLLHYIAKDSHLRLNTVAASGNVWWSQLMHDIGGHARYYKFVADGVKALNIQHKVVSGVVTGEDCGNIADYVINILGNISNPANWSSLISRQLSTNGGIDAECDVGEVADSAMRRFIALAITKQRIKAFRQWRLREMDGYNTNMSLKIATHSGLIGFYTYPDAREDAVVDISRLMIAALNNHSGAMQSWALTNSTDMSADNAAVVESFRMRLCAGLTADLEEDALFIDDARPVCIAHTGADLRLQSSAQLWDPIGPIERVDRYVLRSWPSNGSLPKSVYFTDSKYKGWCGLSYFLNYNNPAVPVIVLHLLSKPEYTVSKAMKWVKEVCQELFAWTKWSTTIEADVVVDIIFSVPDGRIVLPAQGRTATATSAPIPIRQGTGATAAAAMNNEYDDARGQQKEAIAISLDDLQSHIRQLEYINVFQETIPDNLSFSVKAVTAAIASDYFPVRDIFEQYLTHPRR